MRLMPFHNTHTLRDHLSNSAQLRSHVEALYAYVAQRAWHTVLTLRFAAVVEVLGQPAGEVVQVGGGEVVFACEGGEGEADDVGC